jgi:hypothetical protein
MTDEAFSGQEPCPITAEMIARLELAKRSLPNIANVAGYTWEAHATIISEAQAAIAAQAQEIERLTKALRAERAATIERCAKVADNYHPERASAAAAAIRALAKELPGDAP